jgi:hypothetical protein
MIYDALGNSESGKQIYGIDVEALSRNARRFAESWKAGWSGSGATVESTPPRVTASTEVASPSKANLPKPKEWLRYSWQHNLRDGLLSLFSGLGLGVLFYYLGRPPIIEDILRSIEPLSRTGTDVGALARIASYFWLFGLIPVLKGLSQIFYAAFFAESIAKLSERFAPAPVYLAAPQQHISEPLPPRSFEEFHEPVSSVTDHTTQIIEPGGKAGRVQTNE